MRLTVSFSISSNLVLVEYDTPCINALVGVVVVFGIGWFVYHSATSAVVASVSFLPRTYQFLLFFVVEHLHLGKHVRSSLNFVEVLRNRSDPEH